MRTTIELPDDQYAALRLLAVRRGLRGYSTLVSEAVALLLRRESATSADDVLALAGSLSDDDADHLEEHLSELRARPARSRTVDLP